MEDKMIVLTGAAGFIGQHMLQALLTDNIAVFDYLKDNEAGNKVERVRAIKQSLHLMDYSTCLEFLEDNKKDINVVIHLGADSNTAETDTAHLKAMNTNFSNWLFDWCTNQPRSINRDSNIRYVYASSAATYGRGEKGFYDDHRVLKSLKPLNAYAWSKHESDLHAVRMFQQHNKTHNWWGLKFFNVYGPLEDHKGPMMSFISRAIKQSRAGHPIAVFNPRVPGHHDSLPCRDWVYVDDCIEAILACIGHNPPPAGIYNVGTGEAHSFLKAAAIVARTLHSSDATQIQLVPLPSELESRYQYYTKANLMKNAGVGLLRPMTSLTDGISSCVVHEIDRVRELAI